ncbi:hypothetical protein [Enhygromyxa salina]|uniref:hypothetical protein n=1 Tax=Enhygromyxa salina TaxID=215803 RepID=UPI0011BABFB6|nr:hypothetical protein [Enhygromyxa salina]
MAELDEIMLAELGEVRDALARAEFDGDTFAVALGHARLAEIVDSRVLGQLLAPAVKAEPSKPLRLPVPYYGGKFGAAPLIERAMGPIVNLVIPFGGSLGCLLGRSEPARVETANDKDGLIVNAWRAISNDPIAVAKACAMPVHECTLDAVHGWLLDNRESLTTLLRSDPRAHDVAAAAYWLWGRSVWLGGSWCNPGKRGPRKAKVALRGGETGPGIGQGVLSSKIRDELPAYFTALAQRLRHVRMTCGEWTRVLRDSVTVSHGVTGVYLDPCYDLGTGRRPDLYGIDEPEQSAEVRAWALEHGPHPRLRIVLSGLGDEHAELEEHDWSVITWRGRERLWLSPHCRREDFGPLFEQGAA